MSQIADFNVNETAYETELPLKPLFVCLWLAELYICRLWTYFNKLLRDAGYNLIKLLKCVGKNFDIFFFSSAIENVTFDIKLIWYETAI